MGYARIIRQTFFEDPLLTSRYDVPERFFLIGLVCQADDFGKFWLNYQILKGKIFPLDEGIAVSWIKGTIEKFIEDEILCKYKENRMEFSHFCKWFEKGWILKQRIDHPREFNSPDCPICQTEAIYWEKRESSRLTKDNQNEEKVLKSISYQVNGSNFDDSGEGKTGENS